MNDRPTFRTARHRADSFYSGLVDGGDSGVGVLNFNGGVNTKALVISDFHAGGGRGDDLEQNGDMVTSILERYYYKDDWILILNGDIEELLRFPLSAVMRKWPLLFAVFQRFADAGRLYKTLGNHDEDLILHDDYVWRLYDAVKIETDSIPVYVFHGHQLSNFYARHDKMLRLIIRYFIKPLGIHNISSARSPHKRFAVEKNAYAFSLKYNCISIIGHTHRTLFESLGRFDYIKYEIERLCRYYPEAGSGEKARIADEVSHLRVELSKLKRKERRDVLRQSLYGDDLPVPCVFNAGSVIGKKGINAIEINGDTISLVYWFEQGRSKRFISRGWYPINELDGTPYRRSVLNSDRLDYIKARMDIMGGAIKK